MYLAFHVTKFETKIQDRKPSYHYAENVPAPQTTNQVKLNIHDWYMLNKQGNRQHKITPESKRWDYANY